MLIEALTKLGCHRAQGFLFSRPVPAAAVDGLVGSPRNWLVGAPASPPDPSAAGSVRATAREVPGQHHPAEAPVALAD